ncbi:MAG: hypothetical protein INQ03_22745 [Candidatus Heimdallarchaeota archaeon]|nr:hypothetical protein [Candidatus Heimdallarchaeota archaeon]
MTYFLKRLYFGFLAFTIVEILAGSSPNWIIQPWTYFVTIPLYTLHFLFFISLAIRYQKTTLKELYLFGIIIGLYETWITKVIWSGYGHDGNFALGSVLGMGIQETLLLTLFWHPLLAFVFPLVIINSYLYNVESSHLFPDLYWLTTDQKNAKLLRYSIFIFGVLILAANGGNPITVLITAVPNLILLYLGKRLLFKEQGTEALEEALYSRGMSFKVISFLLAFLYIVTFIFIFPEHIPGYTTILVTIAYYLVFIYFLVKAKPYEGHQMYETKINWFKWYSIMFIFAALFSLIIPVVMVLFIIIIILQIPFSVYVAYIMIRR